MGCGASQEENPNEIKSDMKWTKIPELDDVNYHCSSIFNEIPFFVVLQVRF